MQSDKKQGLLIALGHQARVGKDTFADYIRDNYGCYTVRTSKGTYKIAGFIQKYLGMPEVKDPKLLQLIGTGLRDVYSDDIWIDKIIKKIHKILTINPTANIIIPDMRFQNEMEKLSKIGFKTVKIIRKNRPIDRDPNHISETSLKDAKFDFYIDNSDLTMIEFHTEIEKILTKL
ncbi:putative deoxynucleotide monophosphate kinase [Pacmanvirus S19]|nr:putative deoxynucleotide monophosphate kinase [Pacmanvirus S19]